MSKNFYKVAKIRFSTFLHNFLDHNLQNCQVCASSRNKCFKNLIKLYSIGQFSPKTFPRHKAINQTVINTTYKTIFLISKAYWTHYTLLIINQFVLIDTGKPTKKPIAKEKLFLFSPKANKSIILYFPTKKKISFCWFIFFMKR